MPYCQRCKSNKSQKAFAKRMDQPNKLRSWCKDCGRKSANEWYEENKPKALAAAKKWSNLHPQKVRRAKKKYREANKEKLHAKEKERRQREPEKERERLRKIKRNLRQEMIAAYGGQCACCGEKRYEFLTLDHTNGGGGKERKKYKGSDTLLRHLRQLGWPKDGYRVLCWNCNLTRGVYGYCPHEKERKL